MFKKSLWFAIVMSLFVIGANFVDAKGGSSGGFSGGGRSSFSSSSSFSSGSRSSSSSGSSGFSSGSKSSTSSSSGFSSGSKSSTSGTTPSGTTSGFSSGSKSGWFGFSSGSKSEPSIAAPAKPDMMSKSVQQERSNNAYNSTDKAATPSTPSSGSTGYSGGSSTVVKETTIIRDRDRGGSSGFFFVPVWLGGSGSDRTVVVNNGQPSSVQTYDNSEIPSGNHSKSGMGFWSFLISVIAIAGILWLLYRLFKNIR